MRHKMAYIKINAYILYPYTIDTGVELVSVYLLSGLTTTFLKITEMAPRLNRIIFHIFLIIKLHIQYSL